MNPIYRLPRFPGKSRQRGSDNVQTPAGAALGPYMVCLLASTLLAACSTPLNRAPVIDGTHMQQPAPYGYYRVKRGDTLYRIALQSGQDYKNLVAWNNLADPAQISAGQLLRVKPPNAGQPAVSNSGVVTAPVMGSGITTAPLGQSSVLGTVQPPATPPAQTVAPTDTSTIALAWPTREHPILGRFSAANGGVASKGIEIGGRLGEPILSAAPGRVVYTGTLPGYGNLIVIKHNAMYLTAYAHSQSVLVKEGEVVARGQQIATMGTSSNTGRALLHFEVRKYGKAVDPLLYLPPQ